MTRFAPELVFTGDKLSHGKSTAHLYLSENAFPCRSRVTGPINAFHHECARVEHNFTVAKNERAVHLEARSQIRNRRSESLYVAGCNLWALPLSAQKRTSFPMTVPKTGTRETHVVCLDCGKAFLYDWASMRVVSRSQAVSQGQ